MRKGAFSAKTSTADGLIGKIANKAMEILKKLKYWSRTFLMREQ